MDYFFIFYIFCYNDSPSTKKSKKQVQKVIKLKFLTFDNVIGLTYDCNKKRVCKTKCHIQRQFNKLYVIPFVKTLNC